MTIVVAVTGPDDCLLDLLTVDQAVERFAGKDIAHLGLRVSDLESQDLNRKFFYMSFPYVTSAEVLRAAFSFDEETCNRLIEQEMFNQENFGQ